MERHVRPGTSIIDIGTGAGILADAARLIGAGPLYGCDIEHEATLVCAG
jgi:ribosomal protein L11 methylase PrmA